MLKRFFDYINLSRHTTNLVFGNFSYLLFLGFLGVIYIANAHFAEGRVREVQRLQKQIKELKWEYMSTKSHLMYRSMQSQLDTSLQSVGVDLFQTGPKIIQ